MLYKVVLTFKSVDETLVRGNSNGSYNWAVLSRVSVHYVTQVELNFQGEIIPLHVSTQRGMVEQNKLLPPTVESCSDNSIALWREAPLTSEKTAKSGGVCTPCAWSLFKLAELLDELDWRLLWLPGVLCCSNDSSIALMKSISTSSSIAGWLLRWRPKLVWKVGSNEKWRPPSP